MAGPAPRASPQRGFGSPRPGQGGAEDGAQGRRVRPRCLHSHPAHRTRRRGPGHAYPAPLRSRGRRGAGWRDGGKGWHPPSCPGLRRWRTGTGFRGSRTLPGTLGAGGHPGGRPAASGPALVRATPSPSPLSPAASPPSRHPLLRALRVQPGPLTEAACLRSIPPSPSSPLRTSCSALLLLPVSLGAPPASASSESAGDTVSTRWASSAASRHPRHSLRTQHPVLGLCSCCSLSPEALPATSQPF